MAQLSDKSLVKQFAKNSKVTVDLGGTSENSAVNQKLRESIYAIRQKRLLKSIAFPHICPKLYCSATKHRIFLPPDAF